MPPKAAETTKPTQVEPGSVFSSDFETPRSTRFFSIGSSRKRAMRTMTAAAQKAPERLRNTLSSLRGNLKLRRSPSHSPPSTLTPSSPSPPKQRSIKKAKFMDFLIPSPKPKGGRQRRVFGGPVPQRVSTSTKNAGERRDSNTESRPTTTEFLPGVVHSSSPSPRGLLDTYRDPRRDEHEGIGPISYATTPVLPQPPARIDDIHDPSSGTSQQAQRGLPRTQAVHFSRPRRGPLPVVPASDEAEDEIE